MQARRVACKNFLNITNCSELIVDTHGADRAYK